MKIGELSERTGCPVQTIRYYEAEGMLQPAERMDNNYRAYAQAHVDRLDFILRCRSLDMAQDEIRTLIRLQDDPTLPCDEVTALLDAHLHHITERIGALQKLERQIVAISQACSGGRCIGDCGALDSLRHATGPSAPAAQPVHSHVKGVHR
jgi:Cd(II)/Pb(II)-responsive transcriptional regulator